MMNIARVSTPCYRENAKLSIMLQSRMIKVALIRKNKQARADT